MVQFPVLTDKIVESGQKMLKKTTAPTVELIKEIIKAECAYINTRHKDFIGLQILSDPSKYRFAGDSDASASRASPVRQRSAPQAQESSSGFFGSLFGSNKSKTVESAVEDRNPSREISLRSATDREKFQVSLLKTLLSSYFDVVRKNVQDITVKLVWKNVVETARKDLQRQLMSDLYKPEMFEALLRENVQVASQRIVWKDRLATLRKAKEVISLTEIRDE
jgi:dynamin 1-like protein